MRNTSVSRKGEDENLDVNDIESIKLEYITGSETLRALCRKHGLPARYLESRGSREKWAKQREDYRKGVRDKVLEEKSAEDTEKLLLLAHSTEKAVALAAKSFEDPDQFNRYLVSEKVRYAEGEEGPADGVVQRQWTEERVYKKTDTKALKEMTGVLRDLTTLMREFHGLPTKAEAERLRLMEEKLALEKEKMQKMQSVNAVEIVLNAGEEEWNE